MQEYQNKLKGIDIMMETLKIQREGIKKEMKKKYYEDKNVRLKANGKKNTNTNQRVAIIFNNKLNKINSKRIENGLDELSFPKMTYLIVRHIKCWPIIEQDLILYNNSIDIDSEEDVEFNDK